jgi:TP901 family phage tail tape measure protein
MSKISKIIDIKIVGTQELLDLEKAILASEQKLKNMNKASKKNAGMQKIHAKNIVNTKLKLKQLRSERNAESKAILSQTQSQKKLDGSYNSLVARNKQLLTQMKATTGGINSNSASMQKLKTEYTQNNAKLKDFDKSLGNNFRNVGNYGSALGNVKEKLATVGVALGGAVLAFQAVSRIVSGLTKDFGEFEKGFTNVLSLMTKGDIAKFGDDLKSGAIEVMKEFGLEIGDMNKALFDAVSAGVPAGESIEFLRVASELAIGGVTDLTTATDGITTVINAFGLETSEATEVASAFFSAQKFGKTTVEELSQTIGTVAPIAKQAGLGYKELLSAMAVLTKQGLNTNIATTALKGAIGALAKPSESAKKEFDRLGISYGISALRGEGFMKVLEQISVAAKSDADAITKLIPNVKALTGIGALGEAQLRDYDDILQQVNTDYGENSSLANAVAMQQETLEQSQNRLNAEFTAQKTLLGEELKPVFQGFINLMSFFVGKLGLITSAFKTGIVAATAYGVITVLNTARVKGLGIALGVARVKQVALNLAAKMNPYVAAASALLALVYAIKEFVGAGDEVLEQQDKLESIGERAKQSYAGEIKQIDLLMKLAKDEGASREERQKAIDHLNSSVQDLNGSLSLQNVAGDEAAQAMNRYKESLKSSAENNVAVQEQANLTKQIGELNTQRQEAINLTYGAIRSGMSEYQVTSMLTSATSEYDEKLLDLNTRLDEALKVSTNYKMGLEELNKPMSIAAINKKIYSKSVAGLTEKLNDLNKTRKTAIFNTGTYNQAVALITKTQEELNEANRKGKDDAKSLDDVNKMAEGTINEINKKKAEYTKLLKDEIVNSDKYKLIQKEVIRLNEEIKKGDIAKTETKVDVIQKLKDEKAELEKLDEFYSKSESLREERDKNELKLLQTRLDLIIATGLASGELGQEDIKAIDALKSKIGELKATTQEGGEDEDNFMVKLFGGGEEGEQAFNATLTALNSINGLIAARANLQNKETEERIKGINLAEAKEMKSLQDSARFKRMTDEQKADAEKKITDKYEAEREVQERIAFDRNQKMQRQTAIINGAQAVMKIASQYAWPFSLIPIAAQLLMTKMQLDTINKATFGLGGLITEFGDGGELSDGGLFTGASHKQGGIKFHTGGKLMEAEGGEAIINKRSTAMFRNELSAMNQAGGGVKFADGGLTKTIDGIVSDAQRSTMSDDDIGRIASAINTQEVVVTEQQISSTQRRVGVMESRVSF